jgi:DNA-binding GntR family transcriptional regulator
VASVVSGKYLQVAAELQQRIESGVYPAGCELPSFVTLAEEFGVNPRTVQRALLELDRLGLTGARSRRPRVVLGSEVAALTRHQEVAGILRASIRAGELAPGMRVPAETDLAERLGVSRSTVRQAVAALEASGEVVVRGQRRYVAGTGAPSDLAHERLAAGLRENVAAGRYGSGGQLPSESRLAADYGVSRPTVRQALAHLRDEGLIYAVPKSGWFVSGK